MQFFHDLRVVPIIKTKNWRGITKYHIECAGYTRKTWMPYGRPEDCNMAIVRLSGFPTSTIYTEHKFATAAKNIRFDVRIVPFGYSYIKPDKPIRDNSNDGLDSDHQLPNSRDNISITLGRIYFSPRNSEESIVFVYEDTGEPLMV